MSKETQLVQDSLPQQHIEAFRDKRGRIDWKQMEVAGLKLQYIEQELRDDMQRRGHFPTQNELYKERKAALTIAVGKSGGFEHWRTVLEVEQIQRPKSYWTDMENVRRSLAEDIAQRGHFPSFRELISESKLRKRNGIRTKAGGISSKAMQHTGGVEYWRQEFGFTRKEKRKSYWDNKDNIRKELEMDIAQRGHFPLQEELKDEGRSGFAAAISRHGGYSYWQMEFDYPERKKPNRYWYDAENVKEELQKDLRERGHFPTQEELYADGKSSLARGVQHTGGLEHWRQEFGFDSKRKTKFFWKDKLNVQNEIHKWIDEYGHFPTNSELINTGNSGLAAAISFNGGFLHWRERLGHDWERCVQLSDYLEVEDE